MVLDPFLPKALNGVSSCNREGPWRNSLLKWSQSFDIYPVEMLWHDLKAVQAHPNVEDTIFGDGNNTKGFLIAILFIKVLLAEL